MSLQWELEVSRRPRQVVYIRIEADISALTYPNKRQAVCYPTSPGGGAGGGDRGGRKGEKRGKVGVRGAEADRIEGECPYNPKHLPISQIGPRGDKHQLAYEAKHEMRLCSHFKALDLDPVSDLESCSHYHGEHVQDGVENSRNMLHGHVELHPVNVQELAFLVN